MPYGISYKEYLRASTIVPATRMDSADCVRHYKSLAQVERAFRTLGPENITRLRRFAIGLLKGKQKDETIAEKMKKLMLNTRAVFDYLKMTRNSNPRLVTQGLA